MTHSQLPKLVIANWKMNGSLDLIYDMLNEFEGASNLVVCPPTPYLPLFIESTFAVGAQDCSAYSEGPHTGDISAQHLHDVGCTHVIVGHSERRQHHRETDKEILLKAKAAIQTGLTPVICIGESQATRDEGRTRQTILSQLTRCTHGLKPHQYVIAYEPVWAIGTGRTPSTTEIEEVIRLIKEQRQTAVVYGGSVSDQNAYQLSQIADLDGVLVGGASLDLHKLKAILKAFN